MDRQGWTCSGLWQKTLEWLCSQLMGISVAPALMVRKHPSRWVCLFGRRSTDRHWAVPRDARRSPGEERIHAIGRHT